MDPSILESRQKAYLEILGRGLLAIRAAAYDGKIRICEIEADHLHNIPSLINEQNAKRHHYYIVPERKYYIEQLQELGDASYLEDRTRWYAEAWKVLMTIALRELEAENSSKPPAE